MRAGAAFKAAEAHYRGEGENLLQRHIFAEGDEVEFVEGLDDFAVPVISHEAVMVAFFVKAAGHCPGEKERRFRVVLQRLCDHAFGVGVGRKGQGDCCFRPDYIGRLDAFGRG